MSIAASVFAIPIRDQALIYAPLHNVAALVNRKTVAYLQSDRALPDALGEFARLLAADAVHIPRPREGEFSPPFLGLLPTRTCNLQCRYCSFLQPHELYQSMDLQLARRAVNWYMDLVCRTGAQHAEIHYFGGEPFCAPEVLDVTVPLAKRRARESGCSLRFEIATNGVFSEARGRWAADNLDTIVLSFDGPPDIQNHHRPRRGGGGSFEQAARSAQILSEGVSDLCLRACVTDKTVSRMPEIAAWFCETFRPSAVSFEPVQPTPQSRAAGLEPPDPWAFAQSFIDVVRILEAHGVQPIYAPADIRARRVSFCPVGRDVAIVSPDGSVAACYLRGREWEAKGLDLRLGHMDKATMRLDPEAVASVRRLNVWNKPLCERCFCKWHCAGGCHVNHRTDGAYTRLCIQTRIITLHNILRALGQDALAEAWLQDRDAVQRAVLQESDALSDFDVGEAL